MNTIPAPDIETRTRLQASSSTVIVCCKTANGVVLHLDRMVKHRAPVMGGGVVEFEMAERLPETYTVVGNSIDMARLAATQEVPNLIVGGYGITSGIPEEFWNRWLEANKDTELVRGGFIFAMKSESDARKEASSRAKLKSGLEPLDPTKPGTMVRGMEQGTRS